MTEQEWKELGQRAVACKHWRWMPGMADMQGNRLYSEDNDECPRAIRGDSFLELYIDCLDDGWITHPDLRDPATLGCLLYLVREAYGSDIAYVRLFGGLGVWDVCVDYSNTLDIDASTEAEALVKALEAVQ